MNSIHNNPFFLLDATTRDDRRRIVELADEKALELDHGICQKARSDLTNPRARLGAEISWLPGLSPKKAAQLMSQLRQNPMSIRMESGLPVLAHANLLAAAFQSVNINTDPEDLSIFIMEMACIVDEISIDEVIRDINEDRLISGFSEINAFEQVEYELIERKRNFKEAIKSALDCLGSQTLIEVMTLAVDGITSCGECHAPELIDSLVDSYEVETLDFLQQEAESVYKLIKKIRDLAPSGETAVNPLIDKLEIVATNWDNVAQPIQLNAKARGIEHDLSNEIAYSIRSLAIDLFKKYDMLAQTQRITSLLQELFAELPEVVERVEQDANELKDISINRNKLTTQFKDFNLNGNNFSYKEKDYSINNILHISFYRAITHHKTNFIETGKTEEVRLQLAMDSGEKVNISVDELGFLFNKNKSSQINTVVEFYSYLSSFTFKRRLSYYESQIKSNGYFIYDKCYFYSNDKIVFRGKEFSLKSTSFLKGYGYIEMRKKDFGMLDKLKREMSLTKIPQFNTTVDTDVIFYLLKEYFSLNWNP